MKHSEVLKLYQYMKSFYNKKFEIPDNEQKLEMMVNTWLDFLGDFPYEAVKVATKSLMIRKEWSSTPGEIIKEITRLQETKEDKITAGEGWEMVNRAISKHGYFYNPGKVREELPPKVLHVAEIVGLGLIAEKGNDSYVMNLFIKNFEAITEKEKHTIKLPPSLQKETDRLIDKFKGTPQIEAEIQGGESDE